MTKNSEPPRTRRAAASKRVRRSDTYDRLLEAGLDAFVEFGYTGTTIGEIERRVGLAPGTGSFYRHFASKEALLQAAVERQISDWRTWQAAMEAAEADSGVAPGSPQHDRHIYGRLLRELRRFDRLFWLMLAEGDRVPELRDAISSALRPPSRSVGQRSLAVETLALAALGGYHLFSIMQGAAFNGVDEDTFVATLVGLVTAGDGQA